MVKIRSNQFVYPYIPFYDLNDKKFRAVFSGTKIINIVQLNILLNKLPRPEMSIKGKTTEEKIFNVFTDDDVLFGPKEYIISDKDKWLNSLRYFIEKNIPIQFSILGFPFKMPVPLKTDRLTPDMGEVLMLKRLFDIGSIIAKIYKKGCLITIFTEGVFGRYNNQSEKEYKTYYRTLKKLNKEIGFDKFIRIMELEEMENTVPSFNNIFLKKVRSNVRLFKNNDPEFLNKYNNVTDSLQRIVNTKIFGLTDTELMDLYNTKPDNTKLSKKVIIIKKTMEKNVRYLAINYFSYLQVRDDINFLENTIPHVLPMSVSPKPGRLGVLPIDKYCDKLAYHGVPVLHPNKNRFSIEYLIDIKRKSGKYKKVYLKGYPESDKAFYYIKLQ